MNKDWSPAQVQGLRRLHKLSQKELGEFCDVTTSTISRWETGNASPDRRSAVALMRIKTGELSLGSRCLWCGTLHGTEVETNFCRQAQEYLRAFIQKADDEKAQLKATGMWANIRRWVQTMPGGLTYSALAAVEGINLRNAEEILKEATEATEQESVIEQESKAA